MDKDEDFDYFKEKKEVLKLGIEYDRERHEMKMKELAYQRESDRLRHDLEMQRQRIKSAEIRKDREFRGERFRR